jgi:hypothetical protein
MPRWGWLALAVVLFAAWLAWRGPGTGGADAGYADVACTLPPAFDDAALPRQSDAPGMAPFRLGRANVTPLAGLSLQARVLSREDYRSGDEAEFSPTDLALGWGPMAADGIAERLDITQGGRWYRYRWGADGPPLPPALIVRNSANMHFIPADASVADALARVRPGDTVRVDGWLVRIDRDDGWRWRSERRRDDQGQRLLRAGVRVRVAHALRRPQSSSAASTAVSASAAASHSRNAGSAKIAAMYALAVASTAGP